MDNSKPPPPSQQQAAEAQRARHAAELAILGLFGVTEFGGGSSEDDISVLHTIKIAAILTALSMAIVLASFHRSGGKNQLLSEPDHKEISESLLSDAQREFNLLEDSDLTDKQKAVLWATWAYSQTADQIARAIDNGEIPHEFSSDDVELKKVWISRSDARVRPLHADLHGKTVPADGDFMRWPATGQRLRWPGDRHAPADATIGCRCVSLLTWANQGQVSDTIRRITQHTAPG